MYNSGHFDSLKMAESMILLHQENMSLKQRLDRLEESPKPIEKRNIDSNLTQQEIDLTSMLKEIRNLINNSKDSHN